jgi:hypothetical protein
MYMYVCMYVCMYVYVENCDVLLMQMAEEGARAWRLYSCLSARRHKFRDRRRRQGALDSITARLIESADGSAQQRPVVRRGPRPHDDVIVAFGSAKFTTACPGQSFHPSFDRYQYLT